MFKNALYFTILILITIIILLTTCNNNPPIKGQDKIVTKTEIKWDTLKVPTPVYIPKWLTKKEFSHDTFLTKVDTQNILKDYFATYYYKDTVGTDSVNATITESISKNKIISRKVDFNIMYPTITKTTIKNNRQLYIGGGIIGDKETIISFGPGLAYKNKKNYLYTLGIGLVGSNTPSLNISIFKKIGRK